MQVFDLPNKDEATWTQLSRVLTLATSNLPRDGSSLEALVHSCSTASGNIPPALPMRPLRRALEHSVVQAAVRHHHQSDFGVTAASIVESALSLPDHFPRGSIPVLCAENPRVSMSRAAARSVNAHMFLGTVGGTVTANEQPWSRGFLALMAADDYETVAVERLACHLLYFVLTAGEPVDAGGDAGDPDQLITFELVTDTTSGGLLEECLYKGNPPPICDVAVSGDVRIEDSPRCGTHVDFANRDLHIGRVIPSCTQEEVLFSIRPELFPGVLFARRMGDRSAIVAAGARRFVSYDGYLDTFRLSGAHTVARTDREIKEGSREDGSRQEPLVLAIDALVAYRCDQFEKGAVDRDIVKAIVGFGACAKQRPGMPISTGNWGCGAFGGDPGLKFSQQVVAASAVGVDLRFSAFCNGSLEAMVKRMMNGIQRSRCDSRGLYEAVVKAASRRSMPSSGRESFEKRLLTILSDRG